MVHGLEFSVVIRYSTCLAAAPAMRSLRCIVCALLLILVGASAQCSSTVTVSNSTMASSAQFSLPVTNLCTTPTLDFYCSVTPPTGGSALSLTATLRGELISTVLCSWSSLSGSTATQNGTLTRCGDLLLAGAWTISVEGTVVGDASPWSFSVSITTPPAELVLNTSTNVVLGPGLYRTYAVNLTAANGTQEINVTMTGDVARYLPAAIFGNSACPVDGYAYNWRGNASSASFTVSDLDPGMYYLTLVQNERVPALGDAQLLVESSPHAEPPPLPAWWPWAAGVVAIVGALSAYILFDAVRRPLGPQRGGI